MEHRKKDASSNSDAMPSYREKVAVSKNLFKHASTVTKNEICNKMKRKS